MYVSMQVPWTFLLLRFPFERMFFLRVGDPRQGPLAEPAALVVALLQEADGRQVPEGGRLPRVQSQGLVPRGHGGVVVPLLQGKNVVVCKMKLTQYDLEGTPWKIVPY